jgi:CBS domain-containing protein
MTSKTHVVGVDSGVKDAAKMLLKHHVHHLVVMDDGQVVGIVSSMDFVELYASA